MAHARPKPGHVDWTTLLKQLQEKVKTEVEEKAKQEGAETQRTLLESANKIFGGPPPYRVQYFTDSSPITHDIELQNSSSYLASLVTALETTSSIMSQPPSSSTMPVSQMKFVVIPVQWQSVTYHVILINDSYDLTTLGNSYEKFMETLAMDDPRRDAWRKNKLKMSLKKALAKHRSKLTSAEAQVANIQELEIMHEGYPIKKTTIDCTLASVENRRKLLEPKISLAYKPEERNEVLKQKKHDLAVKHPKESRMQLLCDSLASAYEKNLPVAIGEDIVLPLGPKWYALLSRQSKDLTHTTKLDMRIQTDKLKKDDGPFKTKLKKLQKDRQTRWASQRHTVIHTKKSDTLKLWDDRTSIKVNTIKDSVVKSLNMTFSELFKLDLKDITYYDIHTNNQASLVSSDTYLVGLLENGTNIILGSPKEVSGGLGFFFGVRLGMSLSFVGAYVLWASKEKLSKYAIFKERAFQELLARALQDWYLKYDYDRSALYNTEKFKNLRVEIQNPQLQLYNVSEIGDQDFWNIFTWGELKLQKILSGRFVYLCITSDLITHNAMILQKPTTQGFLQPVVSFNRPFEKFILAILRDVSPTLHDEFLVFNQNIEEERVEIQSV